MSRDAKGYYAALEVRHDASPHAIEAAYKRLLEIHHPSAPTCTDGGTRFRLINQAYAVLTDLEQRRTYDRQSLMGGRQEPHVTPGAAAAPARSQPIEPLRCSSCGEITAQPRFVSYRSVVSVIFATYRKPIQGLFCSSCATKSAWKANAITAVAGWWGFPWGPIYTVIEGFKNACGGSTETAQNEKALLRNAVAFASQGDPKLAYALAEKVSRSPITDRAARARDFMRLLEAREGNQQGLVLDDQWKKSKLSTFGQLAILSVVPLALMALIGLSDTTKSSSRPMATEVPAPLPTVPSSATENPLLDAMNEKPIPTCDREIGNAEKLAGSMQLQASGHVLEIENGSSGDAIIKIRRLPSHKLARSFLVKQNEKASIEGLPDGRYAIQYAYGPQLAADCKSFTHITAAGEFPEGDELLTTREPTEDGVMIGHKRLSYTLYSVPSGNIQPQAIDADQFNAE